MRQGRQQPGPCVCLSTNTRRLLPPFAPPRLRPPLGCPSQGRASQRLLRRRPLTRAAPSAYEPMGQERHWLLPVALVNEPLLQALHLVLAS